MERNDSNSADLKDPFARFLALGLGLAFLGNYNSQYNMQSEVTSCFEMILDVLEVSPLLFFSCWNWPWQNQKIWIVFVSSSRVSNLQLADGQRELQKQSQSATWTFDVQYEYDRKPSASRDKIINAQVGRCQRKLWWRFTAFWLANRSSNLGVWVKDLSILIEMNLTQVE